MATVKDIRAREILDSRGNPTIEVDLTLSDGSFGRAAVPSGVSTGSYEAVELRDGGSRYGGKGVLKAVDNVNLKIKEALKGQDWDQRTLDTAMMGLDGTPNKGNLGANAILGVSLAFSHAVAQSKKQPLYKYFQQISKTETMHMPVPMMNIWNGGKHAADSTDLQEFMIVPVGAKSFAEALRMGAETFYALKKILAAKGLSTAVGDEGGFTPTVSKNETAVEIIVEAIQEAGYTPGKDISIAIDAAASEIYKEGKYTLATEKRQLTSEEMIAFYEDWCNKYPIVSIEDGLAEDDWKGYELMTAKLGKKIQIVGDDLFVTNPKRLKMGIDRKVANSILIKLNQIGTVTETIDTITIAKNAGYTSIISHRSGETEDISIADFAVGLDAGQIKTGSVCRGERTAKYNELLRIEEALGAKTSYPGPKAFKL